MSHRGASELEFPFLAPAPLALTLSQGTEGKSMTEIIWCKGHVEQGGGVAPGVELGQGEGQALQVCQPHGPRNHMR